MSRYRALARWLKRHRRGIPPTISVALSIVILVGIGAIVSKLHAAQIESCERGNFSRATLVRNLRSDVHTLSAELALWEVARAKTPQAQWELSPPAVRHAFLEDVAALQLGIHKKRHAVHASITSQADVAIHPGSPIVDCEKAFP